MSKTLASNYWSVLKDALMEQGFANEDLDAFMERYVAEWVSKNLGHMSEVEIRQDRDRDGFIQYYREVRAVFVGGDPKALEKLFKNRGG